MRLLLLFVFTLGALVLAGCGGDDDDKPDLAYETFAPDSFAYIDGRGEDGEVKYPNLEIWEQPVCNYDRVLGNVLHATKVKVLQKKTGCNFVEFEVEFITGDQVGMIGWIRERYLSFEDDPPRTATPTPAATDAATATTDATP